MAVELYKRTALTGGAANALDAIDGAGLNDGYVAHVMAAGLLYVYELDADSGLAESAPDVIAPDTNAGNKRWIRQELSDLMIKGDGTAGLVLRVIRVEIYNGTDADHIKCSTVSVWNGDANGLQDNIGKDGVTTGVWKLSATGQILTLLNAGISGDAVGCLPAYVNYNASGTPLIVYPDRTVDGIDLYFTNATTMAAVDLATLVDTGNVQIMLPYLTSA